MHRETLGGWETIWHSKVCAYARLLSILNLRTLNTVNK